jgi:[acyl-carrier-protein] S-malonyltransferase/trans-AT polyketide synthase/acyltransferase/oxidoreductase domain-containing protein
VEPRVLAFVYPGQGSQKVGMGRDFHDAFEVARRTYEEASEALGLDVSTLCFADGEGLARTELAQPAILATEIAMTRVLAQTLAPRRFGGHSLGEYTALVAAGALAFADALRVVRERGRLMQDAVPVGEGGMTAVTRPALDRRAVASAIAGLVVDVANENSPDQVVLSGRCLDLRVAESRLPDAKLTPLAVSAPFHSRLMRPIAEPFREVLRAAAWGDPSAVVSNTTGTWHTAASLEDSLVAQVWCPVRWIDDMRALAGARVVEIGPARPLRAFFRAMGVAIESVTNVAGLERVAAQR